MWFKENVEEVYPSQVKANIYNGVLMKGQNESLHFNCSYWPCPVELVFVRCLMKVDITDEQNSNTTLNSVTRFALVKNLFLFCVEFIS